MKSTEDSILDSLDGSNKDILPFLNYILQDLWEMGTDPNLVIEMISKHSQDYSKLNVLDLGCGKGAVSVLLANHFRCKCHGIDAVQEFIDYANRKAIEYNVEHLCKFEVGDIRERIKQLPKYDIIILGAIGPVLGDYLTTIEKLKKCLNDNGIIIIDDGYLPDDSDFNHGSVITKSALSGQFHKSGMKILDEIIIDSEKMNETNEVIFRNIKIRCNELIELNPDKKQLFVDYLQSQEEENDAFSNKIICSVIVLKRN